MLDYAGPGLVVKQGDSCSRGREFECQHRILLLNMSDLPGGPYLFLLKH